MAKDPTPTIGEMRRKALISDAEIEAAADRYLTDPKAEAFAFGSGHSLVVAEAIEAHPQARRHLADEGASPGFRRTMVRTAIIMATPSER